MDIKEDIIIDELWFEGDPFIEGTEFADNAVGYNPYREKDGKFGSGSSTTTQASVLAKHESKIRNKSKEVFIAVDKKGKVIAEIGGEKTEVIIPASVIETLQAADSVIFTHNHPSSSSFSANDLITGAKINAKEIRIVSKEYTYSFKPAQKKSLIGKEKNDWPSAENISNVYSYNDSQAYNKYQPKVSSGELTINEAWHMHTNEVMQGFAVEFGATYTRTPSSGDK